MQINLGDARDKLSQLVNSVLDGEQVTICKDGEPVVDLVRTEHKKREAPKLGTMKGKIIINDPKCFEAMTDEEVDEFLAGRY